MKKKGEKKRKGDPPICGVFLKEGEKKRRRKKGKNK